MQVAFSVVAALLVAATALTLVWVIGEQEKYAKDPDAIVFHDGRPMRASTHLTTVRYPRGKVGPVSHFLLDQPLWLNWGTLYLAASIIGWCGSVWLLVVRKKPVTGFFVSLLLAALAGACAYLLVKILMVFIPKLRELSYPMTLLAIVGGLFVTTFYDELEALFVAASAYLQRKLKGKDDNPKQKK
ncbi:MAG TPA: hypothetical protein VH087_03800 [Thermoanaerobaculia bacterium]|nr:hypothetical protein [Thermoanaerobaculia bacterium]